MNLYYTTQRESDAAADFRNAARYDSDVNGFVACEREGDGAR